MQEQALEAGGRSSCSRTNVYPKLLYSHTSAYIEALIEMDSAAECVGETHTDSLFRFLCSIHPGATRFLCVCLEPRERNVRLELSGVRLASIRSPYRCCFLTFVR